MRSNFCATSGWTTKWHIRRTNHYQNLQPFASVSVHIPSRTWPTRWNHFHLIQSTRIAARVSVLIVCVLVGVILMCSCDPIIRFSHFSYLFISTVVQPILQWGGCWRNTIVSVVNLILNSILFTTRRMCSIEFLLCVLYSVNIFFICALIPVAVTPINT